MDAKFLLPEPERILVFGASGRMGPALIDYVLANKPGVKIRIASSRARNRDELVARFPHAEVVIASYFDRQSLMRALADVEAAFVVTPSFLDEPAAMGNFIAAAEKTSSLQQFIRILGDPPGMRLERVPQVLKDFGGGTATQHLIARAMIERSGLPATYLNITNSYMDNFCGAAPMLRKGHWVTPTDRLIGYVDPHEVGEAAARILLSGDARHILQHYNVDNGERPRRNSEVVAMMTEVFGYPIRLIISPERFIDEVGPALNRRYGNEQGGRYMVEYLMFEAANETTWRATDFLATVLGRQPRTLHAWLAANRSQFTTR